MPPSRPPYDEDAVLTEYVCRNYGSLTTAEDRTAIRDGTAAAMGLAAGETFAEFLGRTAGYQGGEEVSPEAVAVMNAWRNTGLRLQRDFLLSRHAAEILIHRCPSCGRIVATPRARQCLWCGHDWHAAPAGASLQ